MSRLIVILSSLAFVSGAAAIAPSFNSTTGVLGIVSGANGLYMLCADGNIYYGTNPSMLDGVETPGAWGPALGQVPVAVGEIVEFWGPGFMTREGTIWVWATAYETYTWIGPGGDTGTEQRRIGEYWSSYPAGPCSTPPVGSALKSIGGVKSLFR